MAKAACSYDLDPLDEAWLTIVNGERTKAGLLAVTEEQFERVIEELEIVCYEKIQAVIKTEEGLGIEYDENVICDVCRSPDSEDANEMVFCDSCNICVHQACYGITTIPSGQWLCRTCSMGQRPDCVLCPNKGGAMKSARCGQKWAHVSCSLWIPEVSIGSVDRMEPITKISSIPQSRWALICVLCRERVGACIQCSVKTCKTAYHVTCAFQHGLEMRAIIEDETAEDGVKLKSYCQKHSTHQKNQKKRPLTNTPANLAAGKNNENTEETTKRKKRKELTPEERNLARIKRLQEIENEFDRHLRVTDVNCAALEVDQFALNYIYRYWILKRKTARNRPLLPPKVEDGDVVAHKQEQADNERMKMFVHLRQDLERVRNLCYMVSRREKLNRIFFKLREQVFEKQATVLMDSKSLDSATLCTILQANHGESVYDKMLTDDDMIKDAHSETSDLMAQLEALKKSPAPKPSPSTKSRAKAKVKPITPRTAKQKQTPPTKQITANLNGINKRKAMQKTPPAANKDNQVVKRKAHLNGIATNKALSLAKIYDTSATSDSDDDGRVKTTSSEENSDEEEEEEEPEAPPARKNTPVNKKKAAPAANTNRGNNKSLETKSIDRRKRRTSKYFCILFSRTRYLQTQ